jgi:hypothetical protein
MKAGEKPGRSIHAALDGPIARRPGDLPEWSGMLRDAAAGKESHAVGSATQEQADAVGRAWVGDGATSSKGGKASADPP